MIYGIYRAHAGSAYGGPVAAYRADDKRTAWLQFCCQFQISTDNHNYKVVAV